MYFSNLSIKLFQREESESRDGSSKHRENSSSSSKKHEERSKSNHKSESSRSSSSKKDSCRDRDKLKSDKFITSTSGNNLSSKKDNNRHSSSSSSQKEKDSSKRDSKHSDKQKHRSSSKKDDHFLYKEKTPRQRSRSKDSNDGSSAHSSSQNPFNGPENSCVSQSTSNNQSANKCSANESNEKFGSHSSGGAQEVVSSNSSNHHKHSLIVETKMSAATSTTSTTISSIDEVEKPSSSQEDSDFVPKTRPMVVVDQILTGNELNLELFIGKNRDVDPIVSSIEQSLEPIVKKPKVAENFYEARKLMKVRKEIDRNNQKRVEQAMVRAKQFIRTNANAVRDDGQGVELEFVCMDKTSAPTISSPVKYINGKEIVEIPKRSTPTSTVTSSTALLSYSAKDTNEFECSESSDFRSNCWNRDDCADTDREIDNFVGYDQRDTDNAKMRYSIVVESFRSLTQKISPKGRSKQATKKKLPNPFVKLTNMPDSKELFDDNHQLFYENNKINHSMNTPKPYNRKRKNTETSLTDEVTNSIKCVRNDDDMFMAKVAFISQTASECSVKPDSSTQRGNFQNVESFMGQF